MENLFLHFLLTLGLVTQEGFGLYMEGFDIPLHFQNVYPGCKTSQDKSDIPECNRTKFLQEVAEHQPEFREHVINTSDFFTCFAESGANITLNASLKGYASFSGKTLLGLGIGYWRICYLFATGPPGTFFEVQNEEFMIGLEKATIGIKQDFDNGQLLDNKPLSTKTNVLILIIGVVKGMNSSFALSYQAVSECQRRLHVRCISANAGVIETFGWSQGKNLTVPTNSCVTLHVPGNDVTMISLVSLALQTNSDCPFPLLVYETSNCEGNATKLICKASHLPPTLFNTTRLVSFKFSYGFGSSSDKRLVGRLGFRLLFSFHRRLQEPRQFPDGKWDCGAAHYRLFRQHFVCHSQTYCSDARDQEMMCGDPGICGINVKRLGGTCYQIFEPAGKTSWTEASNLCSTRGGGLAGAKDASTLKEVRKFTAFRSRLIFIGLRIASEVTSHEMYQQGTWFWADNTLAVYLNLTVDIDPYIGYGLPPFCATLYNGTQVPVSCSTELAADVLCEKKDKLLQPANVTKISLPAVHSTPYTSNTTVCQKRQIAHAFLECDVSTNCNAANQEESITCSRGKTPPVPFFTCRIHGERVPYTLVCDFKPDCCDGSDEDFCTFSACTGENVFQCADGKQCISRSGHCDQRSDCLDGSDESKCGVINYEIRYFMAQVVEAPAVVEFLATGSFTVQRWVNDSCPTTHYQCPGGGYCMPVYTRCNGVNDCPGKEDEEDCDYYTCPGFYRCRNSHVCLAPAYMCDGHFQCPERDDEVFCSIPCPVSCTCYGFAFICSNPSTVSFSSELRYLEITYGDVHPSNLKNNVNLVYLSLKNCGIKELGQLNFHNLLSLDLSHNVISTLSTATFARLKNLVSLSLGLNPLSLHDHFFHAESDVSSIRTLDLSGITILGWYDAFLKRFPNLQHLNMSECELTTMTEKGFQTLSSLRSLDLGGCPMETFYPGLFENLQQLKYINTDNDKLCCPGVMPGGMGAENCKAPRDEISSCDALLRTDVYRFFLALYASLSLIGNLGSFVYRVVVEKSSGRIGFEVFVTHLSVADMLMGVYLAIIGVADRLYSGDYRWKDAEWKRSAACQLAGFLSLLSSELSAFLICLITLERFLVIRFPYKHLRFSPRMAHAASLAGWLVGVVLAVIPLLPVTAHWRFYSQTGICIPLPITRARFPGKDYSFAVMIVMNFLLFLFIAVGQILIYWSIRSHTITCVDAGRKAREKRVARRLLAVVMTDFLCWFPIGLLGMLARYGVPIPGQVNVAIAIFVLPFNSALNPFLYTLNIILERRQNASQAQKYREEKEKTSTQNTIEEAHPESETNNEEMSYSKEEAFRLFKEFVEDGLLTHEQVRRRIWNMYEG